MECFEGFIAHIVEGNRRPQLEFVSSPAQKAVNGKQQETEDMSKDVDGSTKDNDVIELGQDDWDGETGEGVKSHVSSVRVSYHKVKPSRQHLGDDLKMPIDMKASKSPNTQLRDMATNQYSLVTLVTYSSLNKKLKEKCANLEEIKNETVGLLNGPSHDLDAVTPDNKKPATGEEESTLVKKLKQAREKADGTGEEDVIDMKINTSKLVSKLTVEEALTKKFEKQLKKIDDNVKMEEVSTQHSAESLVEDSLNERLKRQQQKIVENVKVEEIKSKHESKSLVEDALSEKLKKRQDKLSGNVKVEEVKSKHEPKTWVEDTLTEKLKKQQEKIHNNIKIDDVKSKHESKSLVEDALSEKLKKRQDKLSDNVKVAEVKSKHEPKTLVEDALSEKLKKQQEKISKNVKVEDVQSKYAAKTWMEDSLGQKLKKQQEKINDNVNVVEVKSKHAPKSLVEDALGEKLKKQQRKIDGFYHLVKDVSSQHTAESTIENGLAEKLRKRRMKIEESSITTNETLDPRQKSKEHALKSDLLTKVKGQEVEQMHGTRASPDESNSGDEKQMKVPEIPWSTHPQSPSVARVTTGRKEEDTVDKNLNMLHESPSKKMDISLGCDTETSSPPLLGSDIGKATSCLGSASATNPKIPDELPATKLKPDLENNKDTRGFASRKLKNLQDAVY